MAGSATLAPSDERTKNESTTCGPSVCTLAPTMSRSRSYALVMRYSTPSPSVACTSTTVASSDVEVEPHLGLGVGRLTGALVAVGAHPVGQPLADRQPAGQRQVEVGHHLVPGERGPEARLDPEHLDGPAALAGHRRVEHAQAVQRQHRHLAEQAVPIGRDDREAIACRADGLRPGGQQSPLVGVGELVGDLVRRASPSTWSTRVTSARTRPAFQSLQAAGRSPASRPR